MSRLYIVTVMYFFPNLEPDHCSMSSSNCCFFTCVHISQEAGKVVRYSHLLKKGFGIVNKAEVDVFLELCCFYYDSVNMEHFEQYLVDSRTSLNVY